MFHIVSFMHNEKPANIGLYLDCVSRSFHVDDGDFWQSNRISHCSFSLIIGTNRIYIFGSPFALGFDLSPLCYAK